MGVKTLKVRGMFGEHCERAIIDSLSHIKDVTDIDVNMREGTITFAFNNDNETLLKIKDAITDEGYDVIG